MSVLLYEKRNQIAYITLNRPDSLNAFNNELIEALGDALVDYRDDPSMLVAILTGTGRAFSTGADLKEMAAEDQRAGERGLRGPLREEVWKPIIAAIDGYALAGGFHVALECDIRIATERSMLGDLGARLGAVSLMSLLDMIPMGEAMYMLITLKFYCSSNGYGNRGFQS